MSSPRVEVADLQASPVDLSEVRELATLVLSAEGREGVQLSVTVVDDERMADLHERYSGIPGPTDVLSFPLGDGPELPGEIPLLGEVVVSADTARREAASRGLEPREELLRYVVHGTLHLLGYDDHEEEDRRQMHERQEELLAGFLRETSA